MKNTIKFFWNGIKVNGKLNKFRFHFDSINYGVNFYADDYEAEMPEHPLFKFFAHAARQARVHYCKNQIKQNERMAKKYGSDYSVQTSKCESEIAEMEIWENPGQPTAADKILGAIDMWVNRTRENSKYIGHYYKTDFAIKWTENGEECAYRGRYDLGDGEGGMLNHIRNFGEWHRTHGEWGKELENPPETNEVLEMVKKFEAFAA